MKQNDLKPSAGSLNAAAFVTMQDLHAMTEFLQNFKVKYAEKRLPLVRKKK